MPLIIRSGGRDAQLHKAPLCGSCVQSREMTSIALLASKERMPAIDPLMRFKPRNLETTPESFRKYARLPGRSIEFGTASDERLVHLGLRYGLIFDDHTFTDRDRRSALARKLHSAQIDKEHDASVLDQPIWLCSLTECHPPIKYDTVLRRALGKHDRNTHFNILKLPPELRAEVLTAHLVNWDHALLEPPLPSIVFSSRELRHEALQIFFGCNSFVIRCSATSACHTDSGSDHVEAEEYSTNIRPVNAALTWLDRMSDFYFIQHIRHLVLVIEGQKPRSGPSSRPRWYHCILVSLSFDMTQYHWIYSGRHECIQDEHFVFKIVPKPLPSSPYRIHPSFDATLQHITLQGRKNFLVQDVKDMLAALDEW